MNTNTSWSSTTNPLTATTNPWPLSLPPAAPSHAGVTLSLVSETFPRRLVDKVRSGQFTEMKELLADNISLLGQLDAIPGLSATHMLGATRPRLREVTSLPSWCHCFLGYVALRISDPITRDQLAYARLLIKEAQYSVPRNNRLCAWTAWQLTYHYIIVNYIIVT